MDVMTLIEQLNSALDGFKSGVCIGVAALCYLFIQLLRGKAGFDIPYATAWIESLNKVSKTLVILGLSAAAGALTAISASGFGVLIIIKGILGGLGTGLMTIGVRNVAKQSIEPKPADKPQL